jgi:hypothetical protein
MTKDEALKLALEALEHEADKSNDNAYQRERDAIKQALAQPEQSTEAHYKSVIGGVQKMFNDKREAQPAPVREDWGPGPHEYHSLPRSKT